MSFNNVLWKLILELSECLRSSSNSFKCYELKSVEFVLFYIVFQRNLCFGNVIRSHFVYFIFVLHTFHDNWPRSFRSVFEESSKALSGQDFQVFDVALCYYVFNVFKLFKVCKKIAGKQSLMKLQQQVDQIIISASD